MKIEDLINFVKHTCKNFRCRNDEKYTCQRCRKMLKKGKNEIEIINKFFPKKNK